MTPTRLRGLYAITPDEPSPERLCARVTQLLRGPVDILQLRMKRVPEDAHLDLARSIQALCAAAQVPLIINDDAALAMAVGAAGVHIGREDGEPQSVRQALAPTQRIGLSCYADWARALQYRDDVDYLAFGSVFASPTKPQAARAPLELFQSAREYGFNSVAIGGITRANAAAVIAAGADAVAVISELFEADDPASAAQQLHTIVHIALKQRERMPPGTHSHGALQS